MTRPRIDITGRISGTMVAVYCVSYHKSNSKLNMWLCRCTCGKEHTKIVRQERFLPSNIKHSPLTCKVERIKLTPGKRIGWFVLIKESKGKNGCRRWLGKCDCGKIYYRTTKELSRRLNRTCTCGCGFEIIPYLLSWNIHLLDIPIDKRKELVHLCRTMKKMRKTYGKRLDRIKGTMS